MKEIKIGVIGGSGIYNVPGIEKGKWIKVETPHGPPSDEIFAGSVDGTDIVFLPRHGRGHVHSPTTVPYKANIYALKSLGVTDLLSISACGSLREDYKPGDFVLVDQFIDRTFARDKTFFHNNCVAHVSMAEPVCGRLGKVITEVALELGIVLHKKGTYLAMEGPQFSTRAESILYKNNWNCDVIGMTNMPEAKLAREAEMCYASVAMVTDFDCWHPHHEKVEVADVIRVLKANADGGKRLVTSFTKKSEMQRLDCECGCDTALSHAVISDLGKLSAADKVGLERILSRLIQ
jgi:5'-methylthioadenosine phosphorylase